MKQAAYREEFINRLKLTIGEYAIKEAHWDHDISINEARNILIKLMREFCEEHKPKAPEGEG